VYLPHFLFDSIEGTDLVLRLLEAVVLEIALAGALKGFPLEIE